MVPHSLIGAYLHGSSQVLWEDGERVFRRGWRPDDSGEQRAILIVLPAADHPFRSSLDHLTHEHELKDELDGAWAARPLELVHDAGRTMLLLEDAGGEPLDRLLGARMEVGRFLRLAISIALAVGKLHQRGLVHAEATTRGEDVIVQLREGATPQACCQRCSFVTQCALERP